MLILIKCVLILKPRKYYHYMCSDLHYSHLLLFQDIHDFAAGLETRIK